MGEDGAEHDQGNNKKQRSQDIRLHGHARLPQARREYNPIRRPSVPSGCRDALSFPFWKNVAHSTKRRTKGGGTLKTIVVARSGHQSVGDHLTEMKSWLNARNIAPRELTMLHILKFRVVFRAIFDLDHEADQFVQQFG
jgi:hypothetical protein